MSRDLFGELIPDPAEIPEQVIFTATERTMLDLVHERYSKVAPGNGPRYVVAEHVRNQCGFGGSVWSEALGKEPRMRTADALVLDLWPSSGNAVHGIEVKISRSDWLTELKDPDKAEAFRPYCDFWWLAVPDAGIVRHDLPPGWGLLVVSIDQFGRPKLRVRTPAPKFPRMPMPFGMTAAWVRAVAKTATRNQLEETP